MSWALVVMACTRLCTVQYVELYTSKAECLVAKPADTTTWTIAYRYHCVTAVKGETTR